MLLPNLDNYMRALGGLYFNIYVQHYICVYSNQQLHPEDGASKTMWNGVCNPQWSNPTKFSNSKSQGRDLKVI